MSELLSALELTAQEYREAYRMNEAETEAAAKPYEWFVAAGGQIRAKCLPCGGKVMGWAMEIRKEYGETINKHTVMNGKHQVIYLGKPVQVWKCSECKQTVVK